MQKAASFGTLSTEDLRKKRYLEEEGAKEEFEDEPLKVEKMRECRRFFSGQLNVVIYETDGAEIRAE